ncbi:XkdX family protein [Paenibacillus sedimenti]|uniref:XkdX family protein n=1 Tax=Paenibacillus sedimenti TaxID=2770274 RepID=A0A926KQW9_9BACL|nr:XkdX family protein [Paenibacillus sedimenti]MBD0381276.1 XkdX family protein [Paenibacillus sedimenti]
MTDFERIKMYFDRKWANVAQIRQYVSFGKITPEQFTEITNEVY